MSADLQRLVDEAALRRTAELYARGADRRDKALWRAVLSPDCVIEGPGFKAEGLEANLGSIDALEEMFQATLHRIHQQVVTIDGDRATGETHCTADHLLAGGNAILVWAIRYQDDWQRQGGEWRFVHRRLIVDWQETRSVTVQGEKA